MIQKEHNRLNYNISNDIELLYRTRNRSPYTYPGPCISSWFLSLRSPIKPFLKMLKRKTCKCGHGLESHEYGKCTNHIGFHSACPCDSYEPQ